MSLDNDDDNPLAGIDLHAWRVPPPVPAHRPAILVRALTPAAPLKRRRLFWMLAAAAAVNAAAIAILLIIITRPAAPSPVVVAPAGGPLDTQIRVLIQQLAQLRADEEAAQRELEAKRAELEKMQALVDKLTRELSEYSKTVQKKQPKQTPPVEYDFEGQPAPPSPENAGGTCDEVSCVLTGTDPCCAKFRKQPPRPARSANDLPEALDRAMISAGIASVKNRVRACADHIAAKGKVKVKVRVSSDGLVNNVVVEATPSAPLGACVAGAVQRAVFAKTQMGGSFSYPFIF